LDKSKKRKTHLEKLLGRFLNFKKFWASFLFSKTPGQVFSKKFIWIKIDN
jgi:hypothetical protein